MIKDLIKEPLQHLIQLHQQFLCLKIGCIMMKQNNNLMENGGCFQLKEFYLPVIIGANY